MAATLENRRENIVVLADVRAVRRLPSLPLSLEIDLEKLHADDKPMGTGQKIWFAVVVSTALWAVIAGAIWFV